MNSPRSFTCGAIASFLMIPAARGNRALTGDVRAAGGNPASLCADGGNPASLRADGGNPASLRAAVRQRAR